MSEQSKHPPLNDAQRTAIARIEALNGTVLYVPETDQQVVESITFRGPLFTDEQISLLEPFYGYDLFAIGFIEAGVSEKTICKVIHELPDLKHFAAMKMPVGDEVLKSLAGADQLVALSLSETRVTSAGLKHLVRLSALEDLNFHDTNIDDSGLQSLKGLSKLRWLGIGRTQFSSGGLQSVGELEDLDTLLLHDSQVTDDGLRWLGKLKKLRMLRLDDTKVTDDGIKHLCALDSLKELVLTNTAVSDKGLQQLQNHPKLERVNLKGTKVSSLSADRFHVYLPANSERFRKHREQFERGDLPAAEAK